MTRMAAAVRDRRASGATRRQVRRLRRRLSAGADQEICRPRHAHDPVRQRRRPADSRGAGARRVRARLRCHDVLGERHVSLQACRPRAAIGASFPTAGSSAMSPPSASISHDQVYVLRARRTSDDWCSIATVSSCAHGARAMFTRPHGVHIGPDDSIYLHRRRRSHRSQVQARRQAAAEDRHVRQARAVHERAAVPSLHPYGAGAERRHLRVRRLRQRAGASLFARTASSCRPGASRALGPVSSTSLTTSAATRTAGFMSPTARTIASRCSTATAITKRSGTISIVHAASACAVGERFFVAELAPGQEFSNRNWPHLGPRVSILEKDGSWLARLGDYGGAERAEPVHRAAWYRGGLRTARSYVAELSHAVVGKKVAGNPQGR